MGRLTRPQRGRSRGRTGAPDAAGHHRLLRQHRRRPRRAAGRRRVHRRARPGPRPDGGGLRPPARARAPAGRRAGARPGRQPPAVLPDDVLVRDRAAAALRRAAGDHGGAGGPAAKFDLSLFVAEAADGARGMFEYATAVFDRATVERLARRFVLLLRGIVADPARPVADLPIVPDDERREQLADWNATGTSGRAAPSCTSCSRRRRRPGRTRRPSCSRTRGELPRTRRPRRPGGRAAAAPRGRSGERGRGVRGTVAGDGGRAAGRAEGGRRVRPARPRLSARPARLHGARQRSAGAGDPAPPRRRRRRPR